MNASHTPARKSSRDKVSRRPEGRSRPHGRSIVWFPAVVLGSLIGVALLASQPPGSRDYPKPGFTMDGQLKRPQGYRHWTYIGTPITPNDLNPPEAPFPDFHNVYIHPDDFDHYEQTGEFADGTVLVKELVKVGSREAPSGNGYFMGEFIGLEAAIKDSRRFKDEPGYWGYFSFGHEYPLAKVAPKQEVSTCNVCHAANAGQDWVFAQYYPVLRAAKPE